MVSFYVSFPTFARVFCLCQRKLKRAKKHFQNRIGMTGGNGVYRSYKVTLKICGFQLILAQCITLRDTFPSG